MFCFAHESASFRGMRKEHEKYQYTQDLPGLDLAVFWVIVTLLPPHTYKLRIYSGLFSKVLSVGNRFFPWHRRPFFFEILLTISNVLSNKAMRNIGISQFGFRFLRVFQRNSTVDPQVKMSAKLFLRVGPLLVEFRF